MASPNTTVHIQDTVVLNPWDDPINILSLQGLRTIEKFILVFQPCVLVIGLFTNVVNGVVFWRQGLRDRMNLCLFCLSLSDLGYLVTIFLILTVSSIMEKTGSRLAMEYSAKATVYGYGFMFSTAALSRLISMVIAVERCLCVVFPLRATSLIRTRTMAYLLAALFVFVQVCYSTLPLSLVATSVQDNVTGEVTWLVFPSSLSVNNYKVFEIVYFIIPRVVIPVGTFLTVLFATCITVVRLRAAMSWRQQTSSSRGESQSQQMALTKMLVIILCIDITCSAPSAIQAMLEIFCSEYFYGGPLYNLGRATGPLSAVFICINSSINFFVYFTLSTRYKHSLQVRGDLCLCLNKFRRSSQHQRNTDATETRLKESSQRHVAVS